MTYIKELRQQNENVVLLDTGDALRGGGKLGEKTRGEAIIAGMNLMAYDAMALGPNELSLGRAVLSDRLAGAKFPILSANVVLSDSQKLLVEPFTILTVGGKRLGVLGLTRQPELPLADFQVLDPKQAAAEYVPRLAAQADVVIVLTNLPVKAAQPLAQAVPGIDLVIAALPDEHPSQSLRDAQSGALIVVADMSTSGHSGRRVGMLTVAVRPDGSLAGEQWQSRWIDKTIADDPEMTALLARYQ